MVMVLVIQPIQSWMIIPSNKITLETQFKSTYVCGGGGHGQQVNYIYHCKDLKFDSPV